MIVWRLWGGALKSGVLQLARMDPGTPGTTLCSPLTWIRESRARLFVARPHGVRATIHFSASPLFFLEETGII